MHVQSGHAPHRGGHAKNPRSRYRPAPGLRSVQTGSASIGRGHRGEDVRSLQRQLNEAGARPPLDEDGMFGPRTQAAVRRYQRQHGLTPDGRVGRNTLSQLRGGSSRAEQGDFTRGGSAPSARAPHVEQRAPEGTVTAGSLQRDADAARAARRSRGTPPAAGGRAAQRSDEAAQAARPAPRAPAGQYDGSTPAPSVTSQRASAYVDAPVTNSEAAGRSRETYDQVINQFAVGENPRYARRRGNTYCNIFASDVTRAMGAGIPHWITRDGNPAEPYSSGAHEISANGTNRWLHRHGARHGWRQVSAEEAQRHANQGRPAVASRANPGGIGHIAVVRPGEITDRGPAIAQAGARNFNEGHVGDVWRRSGSQPEYWVHD